MSTLSRNALMVVLLLSAACVGDPEIVDAPEPPITSVTVTPNSGNLQVGETLQLTAVAINEQGGTVSGANFTWTSSNPAVASVSGSGLVMALGPGSTTISASTAGRTGSATINVTVPVASVAVTPSSATVEVGSTFQFSATPRDAGGNPLTGRAVSWMSSNPGIASVDASGLVAGVAPGAVTITATSEGVQGTATVTVPVPRLTINVANQLLTSVRIIVNGVTLGTVTAQGSDSFQIDPVAQISLTWELIRPTTNQGTPVGESYTVDFNPVTVGSTTTFDYTIDNVFGSITIFAPIVTNNTSVDLLMGVNMDLASENRCNCLVPANTTNVFFGYYRLFSNSNVRGYNSGSNYTGNYVFWDGSQINGLIQTGSGRVGLTANVAPGPGTTGVPSPADLKALPLSRPVTVDGKPDEAGAAARVIQGREGIAPVITRNR